MDADLSRPVDIFDRLHHALPLGTIVDLVGVISDIRIVDAPRVRKKNSSPIGMALNELHYVEVEVVDQYVGWNMVLRSGPGVIRTLSDMDNELSATLLWPLRH